MKKRFLLLLGGLLLAGLFMTTQAYAQEATTDVKAGTVTGNTVNVRTTPSTGGKWVCTLFEGNRVLVLGQEGAWYKVSYQGYTGYMFAEYMEPFVNTEGKYGHAVVTGSFVRVRSTPDTDGTILGTLSEGLNVKVLGVEGGWYKVEYGSIQGYMSPEFLEPIRMIETVVKPPPTTTTAKPSASTSTSKPVVTAPKTDTSLAQKIINTAKKYIGVRYVYGGASPSSGFDCSGLVTYVFKQYGISFRQRTRLYLDGANVSYSKLAPGDLVFFDSNRNGTIGHVGIYVGGGQFIHAPRPGSSVRVEGMTSGFYRNTFVCARRIV